MIVLAIETSGLDFLSLGIWQIGAIDLNTMEEFFDECRIDDEDIIEKGALEITGKTKEELRNKNKQSQKELLKKFFEWTEKRSRGNFLCHSPQWDIGWICAKASKYGLTTPFHYRAFDLHTIAQTKFHELNKEFLIKENHSVMGLEQVLKFCGLEDNRKQNKEGKITEGKPHNALEDAKLTAECFLRLVFGKNLFPEFAKFEIPQELRK